MIDQRLAPVWEYLAGTIRGNRLSGRCDPRLGPFLEEYVGHCGRLVRDRQMTLAEGLVLAQEAVRSSGRLQTLEEARHVRR